MKTQSRRSGFSLVELLTVIAIIAILAAIIFPVMGMVKERARQNQCMSNIKQIGLGLGLFKTDNRRYPEALVPVVDDPSGNPKPFDQSKSDAGLMGEYVKGGFSIFHCPSSKETDKTIVVTQPLFSAKRVYQYNSYEGMMFMGTYEQHYCLEWAKDLQAVADSKLKADGNTDAADYQRQLKFRNPPDDTVVTWCSWHENRDATSTRGKTIVLFLGGEAVLMDAAKVKDCKWRIKQQ